MAETEGTTTGGMEDRQIVGDNAEGSAGGRAVARTSGSVGEWEGATVSDAAETEGTTTSGVEVSQIVGANAEGSAGEREGALPGAGGIAEEKREAVLGTNASLSIFLAGSTPEGIVLWILVCVDASGTPKLYVLLETVVISFVLGMADSGTVGLAPAANTRRLQEALS